MNFWFTLIELAGQERTNRNERQKINWNKLRLPYVLAFLLIVVIVVDDVVVVFSVNV